MKKTLCYFFVVLFWLVPCGCNRSKLKGLVPGAGTITFNDEPVEDALILFAPVNPGSAQRSASAKSGANGSFSLMTLEFGDGIYPGEYKVIAKKTQTTGSADIYVSDEDKRNPELRDDRATIHLLPFQYSDPSMTDLIVTIPPKGDKSISLQLEGEVDTTPMSRYRGRR